MNDAKSMGRTPSDFLLFTLFWKQTNKGIYTKKKQPIQKTNAISQALITIINNRPEKKQNFYEMQIKKTCLGYKKT